MGEGLALRLTFVATGRVGEFSMTVLTSGCPWIRLAFTLLGALRFAATVAGSDRSSPDDGADIRISTLRAEIERHDELYFKEAEPEISDAEYDRLKRELESLERGRPEQAAVSRDIGDDRTGRFPTYPHRERMLSLNKAYSEAEWHAFYAKLAHQLRRLDLVFTVEPKYDGIAISITYERGVLVRAVTRGNGAEGDDVTVNAKAVRGLLVALSGETESMPQLVELRGEIYVDHAEFRRLNAEREASGETSFAHPRNLAAGTLRATDVGAAEARRLSLVIFGWGAWEGTPPPRSQLDFNLRIKAWGLPGVTALRIGRTAGEVWSAVRAIGAERSTLPFPIDGVVVKLDDVALRAAVGASEQAPRWGLACKYEPTRAVTRLRAITLQVGRTGVLTPVAEFDPVVLGGSVVTRATLHNHAEIARRDLRVGDSIEVEKAGEIIPAIVGVRLADRVPDAKPFQFPNRCPSCDTPVVSARDQAAVRCPGARCPAQRQRRLEHFASSQAIDLDGFGPATIAALIKAGLLANPEDFYVLRRRDVAQVEGIGERTADRLVTAVERRHQVELWRIIHGLGVPQLGESTSRKLAAVAGNLNGFSRLTETQLRSAIGPSAAASVADFLARTENQASIHALIAAGLHPGPDGGAAGSLHGKVFVFTGSLPSMTRVEAVAKVLAAGGEVRDGVSGQTDFLVAGEGAGRKLVEAEAQGVRVIDAAEFKRMVGTE